MESRNLHHKLPGESPYTGSFENAVLPSSLGPLQTQQRQLNPQDENTALGTQKADGRVGKEPASKPNLGPHRMVKRRAL